MSDPRDKNTASAKLTFGMMTIYLFGNDEAHIELGNPVEGMVSMECKVSDLERFFFTELAPAMAQIQVESRKTPKPTND